MLILELGIKIGEFRDTHQLPRIYLLNKSHNLMTDNQTTKTLNQSPNIIDILLSRHEANGSVDSTTLIKNVQNRINNALENGYQYTRVTDSSEKFLRKNVFQQLNMAVIYVDLVGSTKMSIELPPDKLSTLISSFSQEMAYVINAHNGYVLKFVGDAVIGYFAENESSSFQTVDNAVGCAESMIKVEIKE